MHISIADDLKKRFHAACALRGLKMLEQRLEKFAAQNNPQTAQTTAAMATAGKTWSRYVLEPPEGQVPLVSDLLKHLSQPIILALDGIDQLFEYPELASDFFVLLRSWYEETKDSSVWQKLRVAIAHAVEVYIPLPTHRSPFNVGLAISLPTFNPEQVQDLALRHGLQLTTLELEQLMKLTSGFPYLIRLALYQSARLKMTVQTLLQDAMSDRGIYHQHLRYQLWNLQQRPKLADAFQQVLTTPIQLEIEVAFKLKSLGLVHIIENQATVSCELYREYFLNYFS